ncbi:hypothetical protein [Glaciimonas soli]|uniref:HEPN domain-containing protein n=1 Tax=Glaciimonas soli TaxID=2590999 RepID=A0A843YWV9_9BURK|nr:hypothetical protein [Glaciimonas soli]MQR02477.1 hypothetical protein [Glaciimonas soli]
MSKQIYSRLKLAQEQLEVALLLFLEKQSYPSAITLAGAAEEIFGKELVRRKKQPNLDWKFDQMAIVHKLLHGKDLERKTFFANENLIRNALKHLNATDTPEITIDLEDTACWMVVRACENARMLDLDIALFQDFDEWFQEHIVGV